MREDIVEIYIKGVQEQGRGQSAVIKANGDFIIAADSEADLEQIRAKLAETFCFIWGETGVTVIFDFEFEYKT